MCLVRGTRQSFSRATGRRLARLRERFAGLRCIWQQKQATAYLMQQKHASSRAHRSRAGDLRTSMEVDGIMNANAGEDGTNDTRWVVLTGRLSETHGCINPSGQHAFVVVVVGKVLVSDPRAATGDAASGHAGTSTLTSGGKGVGGIGGWGWGWREPGRIL